MAIKGKYALKRNEIYGMEFGSGYKMYYVFGTDPLEMFKRIVKMYNTYSHSNYNSYTFRRICSEEGYYFYLYKFDITKQFSFDDDCFSMGSDGGTKLGEYIELLNKGVI